MSVRRPDFDEEGFGPGLYLVKITAGGYSLWRVTPEGLWSEEGENVLADEAQALLEYVEGE